LAVAALLTTVAPSRAQSTPDKPADQKGASEKREAVTKGVDDINEINNRLAGQPEGKPECYWLGRRMLSRMWVDDLDTAFRHLDLYDRFGCPGGHIQATFRCMARQGDVPPDPKDPNALNNRIRDCWTNPSAQPAAPAAAARGTEQGTSGTTAR
jgi:hypothetical protein